MKKSSPIRPIVEEEFENSPRNREQSSPPVLNGGRQHHVEEAITPQQVSSVQSAPPTTDRDRVTASRPVPNNSMNMQPLPNGNVLHDRVQGVPFEHANPTYDYTEKDQGYPKRTVEIEEPMTEVRLKPAQVQLHSLGEKRSESLPPSRSPSNVGNYQPQPLRAQQQKIKFVTQYDDPNASGSSSSHVTSPPLGRPRPSDDGFQWLQRQQDKLKEQKEKDVGPTDRYSNPLQVREPGVQPSYQGGVHQSAPSQADVFNYSPGMSYSSSGLHSPGNSVKSEPINTSSSSRPYIPDNRTWLEQQQTKLRERRQRERLPVDPSHPLQVDTSYSASQLPSQPSSVSSVRSDVSGFSNTPYSQQRQADSMASRRGHLPEPLHMAGGGGQTEAYQQPPPRRGPPTPAYGYDNMSTTPRQGVLSPTSGPLLEPRLVLCVLWRW